MAWTPERVLQRYPLCPPAVAGEVAALLTEAHERKDADGMPLTHTQALGVYCLATQLAGAEDIDAAKDYQRRMGVAR